MIGVTVALLLVVATLCIIYVKWKHSYWSSRNVQGPPPVFILGHAHTLLSKSRTDWITEMYNKYKKNKFFGYYENLSPAIFVYDPELVKLIMIKNFDSFTNFRKFTAEGDEGAFSQMLFSINGPKWKKLRSSITPMFSSGKMKLMFPIVQEHARVFAEQCSKPAETGTEVDIKELFNRYTLDVIADTAFGMKSNSLTKKTSEFVTAAQLMFQTSLKSMVQSFLLLTLPRFAALLGISFDDDLKFFKQVSEHVISERKDPAHKRGDFVDLLLDHKAKQEINFNENDEFKIDDKVILAQSIMFLMVGFETTSNALSFTAYFLSTHQDKQTKLREELQELIEKHGQLNYEAIAEAKYLEACISEALRIYSTAAVSERECVQDFKIPDSDVTITKGMMVTIPIWAIQRDPEYWPEPEEFIPERFMPENKDKIVPMTYLPFGAGPRNCVAMRFALLEAKLCLAELIINYGLHVPADQKKIKMEHVFGLVRPINNTVSCNVTKL